MSPRRNWDSPTPSLAWGVCPPPQTGGGAHSPEGEGLGKSKFRRLEKKLSTLPTLHPSMTWIARAFLMTSYWMTSPLPILLLYCTSTPWPAAYILLVQYYAAYMYEYA